MRVLVAFDKFKDSLTATQACEAAERAIRQVQPGWQIDACPLADGGEGFVEILTRAAEGELVPLSVDGPRGGTVRATIGLVRRGQVPAAARNLLGGDADRIAVVEMAAASGLALLPPEARDPWQTSSRGTGQLIRAAAELRAGLILLGVGGSATNDLGLGALSALGFEFRGAEGEKLRPPVPALWRGLSRVEGEIFDSVPPIRIACDVSNPLLGPRGCAAVFGPQKGLKAADHARLEAESARIASLLLEHCGQPHSLREVPGAGAAGGIAFGLMAAAGAKLLPGAALVGAWLDLESRLAAADLILTGEGSFDASSLEGKGPGALAARAAALGKPVHVFAGRIELGRGAAGGERGGGDAASTVPTSHLHAISPPDMPLDVALARCAANLTASVAKTFAG